MIDFVDRMIIGTGYASSGWPKPYFTVEEGQLIHHNNPVPLSQAAVTGNADLRYYLAHSAVLDQFMTRLFPNYWFNSGNNGIVPVATDKIRVTCGLLKRLKQKADRSPVKLVLYRQYGAPKIVEASRLKSAGYFYRIQRDLKQTIKPWLMNTPPGAPSWQDASAGVADCARSLQIPTVNELSFDGQMLGPCHRRRAAGSVGFAVKHLGDPVPGGAWTS